MSAGIDTRFGQGFVGFWCLIDSAYACILRSLCALSVVRDGKAPCPCFCKAERN